MKILKGLVCKHNWEVIEPIYGDMKSDFIGYCKCKKCGKNKLK